MKLMTKILAMLPLIISLAACAHSQVKKIENPTAPFERAGYSIAPPSGEAWTAYLDDASTRYNLSFFRKLPDDPDYHSRVGGVIETPNSARFESVQEFESWTKRTIEMAMNPNRLQLLDKKFELDNKFGPFTLKYYTKSEDHRAVNKGNEPFLLLEDYGCIFVHPKDPNLIIQVSFSERGKPGQIRSDLKQAAESFFDGIIMK